MSLTIHAKFLLSNMFIKVGKNHALCTRTCMYTNVCTHAHLNSDDAPFSDHTFWESCREKPLVGNSEKVQVHILPAFPNQTNQKV